MNHTSKSDMEVNRLNNQQFFEDLVRLENLLADLQENQRGKWYMSTLIIIIGGYTI